MAKAWLPASGPMPRGLPGLILGLVTLLVLIPATQGVPSVSIGSAASVGDFTLTSQAANITLAVNGTGGFVWEGAANPVPPGDGALTYGGGYPWPSDALSVNDSALNGTIYCAQPGNSPPWGDLNNFVVRSGALSATRGFVDWVTPSLTINETYTLEAVAGEPGLGYVAYNATVTNRGPAADIRVRFYFDTQLNYNDGAPFFVPGLGEVTTEVNFSSAWPFIEDFDNYSAPSLVGLFTPLPGSPSPYLTSIAEWPTSQGTNWTYVTNPANDITYDSAILFYYDLGTLGTGQSSSAGVNYGLGQVSGGSLKVNSITPDRSQYTPGQAFSDEVVVGSTQNTSTSGTLSLGVWGSSGSSPALSLSLPITTRPESGGLAGFTYLNFTGSMPTPTGLYQLVATLSVNGKNVSSANAVVSVVPFQIGATHFPSLPTSRENVTFTVTVNIAQATNTTLYVDGAAVQTWAMGSGTFNLVHTPLAAGTHTYNVTTHEPPGNSRVSGGPWSFLVVASPGGVVPLTATLSATPNLMWQGNTTTLRASVSGGTGPYTYSWNSLPPGCTSSDVATLTCAPTATGNTTVSVTVTDSSSPTHQSVTVTTHLEVVPAPGIGTGPGGLLAGLLNAWPYLVLILVVVAVLGLALAIRRRRGRKVPSQMYPPPPPPPPMGIPPPPPPPGNR